MLVKEFWKSGTTSGKVMGKNRATCFLDSRGKPRGRSCKPVSC